MLDKIYLTEIDIDVPGALRSVYPGHNILFSGTMNEDESTQALSDKVLDRANIMRFRKPEKLVSETISESEIVRRTHLPFDTASGEVMRRSGPRTTEIVIGPPSGRRV